MSEVSWKKLNLPIDEKELSLLKIGDSVLISGQFYTARDKAHSRICKLVEQGKELPVDFTNSFIFYVGPSPTADGEIVGSAGPTTSYRMDGFTECMLKLGVKGMIGKGKRDRETRDLLSQYGSVYFSSFGGAGAYLAKRIVKSEVVAFDDLGPEAIHLFTVKDFPVVVANDIFGGDIYEQTAKR